MLTLAAKTGIVAAGLFLLTGMLTGIWKYRAMLVPPAHEAPPYVDIAHRASLLYSFASLVLAALAQWSAWPEVVNLAAMGVALFYFASAIASYLWHGALGRKVTQLSERNFFTPWGMGMLIAGEIGGLLTLLSGFVMRWP